MELDSVLFSNYIWDKMKSSMIYIAFWIQFLQLVVRPGFDAFVNTNVVTPYMNTSDFPGVSLEFMLISIIGTHSKYGIAFTY